MGLAVNVLCRNMNDDRVIPRFSRYLRDHLGWNLTARPDPAAEVYYLSGYFEWPVMRRDLAGRPMAAYFTHIETQPPGNAKAKLFHSVAEQVDLRIATAAMYVAPLAQCGPTAQLRPPVERHRFTPPSRGPGEGRLVAGFSGYTYGNGRKGEALAKVLLGSKIGRAIEWRASGRGWPVPTRKYNWSDMPGFYQSLDILVVTSMVEGIPMPPLEMLACGGSIVIPRGVGLLDELPDVSGLHRYQCGDTSSAVRALEEATKMRPEVDQEALRSVTEPYTVYGWSEGHQQAFEAYLQ